MTAIPALRPPRQSPATAYLRHLSQRRKKDRGGYVAALEVVEDYVSFQQSPPPPPTTSSSSATTPLPHQQHGDNRRRANNNGGGRPRSIASSNVRSVSTTTCASTGSGGSSSSASETEPNSEESCSSHFLGGGGDSGSDNDLFFSSPPSAKKGALNANDSYPSTAIVPVSAMPSRITPQLVAVESEDGSFALEALLSHDDDNNDGDDDSAADALDKILAETSKRWKETCQQNHKEFCRVPDCDCKQREIIERQAAEIEALRAQLVEAHESQNHQRHHHRHHGDEYDVYGCDNDDGPREDILPIEQIEVYHDSDDHLSVTSGLTHMYDLSRVDDASVIFGGPPSKTPTPTHRPDSESVTGIQSVQPSRVREMSIDMVAADGVTLRKALYSGPTYKGRPHGCGILKFVESGDVYMGDLVDGEMHGQGTYTVKGAGKRKHQVLRGTFQNNVFTGSWDQYDDSNAAVYTTAAR